MQLYWERHPDGPFVTLIRIATNYLHPEWYDLDLLKGLAQRDNDDEMQIFKSELREALRDPDRLPDSEWSRRDGALSESVQYDHGSDVAFLVWLWHELYGDEDSGAGALTRLRALPEPFAERLHTMASWDVRDAVSAGEWDRALELLLAGLAESNAPVSAAEREELTTLLAAAGRPAPAIAAVLTPAAQFDVVRTRVVADSLFDSRSIPAGMQGTVLETRPDGSCLVELAFRPQTAEQDGDFVVAALTKGQYEVIIRWSAP
jgi:hypothetical protein